MAAKGFIARCSGPRRPSSGLGHHLEHLGGDKPSWSAWRRALPGSLGRRLSRLLILVDDHAARAMTITGAHPSAAHEPGPLRDHGNCDVVKELEWHVRLAPRRSPAGPPVRTWRTPSVIGPNRDGCSDLPSWADGGRRRGRSGPGSYPPTRQIGISLLVKRCSRSCSVGPTAGVALRHQAGQPGAVASIWTTSANSASR